MCVSLSYTICANYILAARGSNPPGYSYTICANYILAAPGCGPGILLPREHQLRVKLASLILARGRKQDVLGVGGRK